MSEDSEDIIKKLTEDVPDGKATFPADEDDEFNLLLDNFIQSELKTSRKKKQHADYAGRAGTAADQTKRQRRRSGRRA